VLSAGSEGDVAGTGFSTFVAEAGVKERTTRPVSVGRKGEGKGTNGAHYTLIPRSSMTGTLEV
jgi:hypothetical protein